MAKKVNQPEQSLFDEDAQAQGDAGNGNPPAGSNGSAVSASPDGEAVALHSEAQSRYLNYALSVITSRALPDVRDGLKPVQRRILYTMWQQNLTSDAKHRKSATVVGAVLGNYHPHGDSSVYEAMVRMAQPFAMRMPLVDGSGNFGSLDGDAAAAMRYTEARLTAVSNELLEELEQDTVPLRPNYDGTRQEPTVLPARLPNLLINGTTGIAVGMATNIPPHNPSEVCTALIKLLENPELKTAQLCRYIKGPDFPTGGQVLSSAEELRQIYHEGTGSIKVRSTYEVGPALRSGKTIIITSVPYAVNKAQLVERIAEVVLSRKMPLLLDVKDLSTDDVRIELLLKKDADEQKVMAYLFKNTPLQSNFAVNMTCLLPTENPQVGRPQRCGLGEVLNYFLQFRLEVVTRRLEHELRQLQARIHILEGFETVFDALDEIIRIIRKSEGKADAAEKIMAKFPLDADQTDAILELKLYRLARLEILVIRNELETKRKRAAEITRLLGSEDARWGIVRSEIEQLQQKYFKADKRRTKIEAVGDEPQFTEDDFIVEEDNQVVITRDGWVKRQKEIRDASSTRLREGDSILAVVAGSTRATCVFFSNFGSAYTSRIIDIPASTGYGEPIQKFFKLRDGERIIAAVSMDARAVGDITAPAQQPEAVPPTHALAASSDGYALRFSLEPLAEASTRSGRRYAKVPEGVEVVGVAVVRGNETVIAASKQCRAILCPVSEVNFLAAAGRGVILIKLEDDDRLLGFKASTGDRDLLVVETHRGAKKTISTAKYEVTGRGGRGREIQKNGSLSRIVTEEVTEAMLDDDGD